MLSGAIMNSFADKRKGFIWGWRCVLWANGLAAILLLKAFHDEYKIVHKVKTVEKKVFDKRIKSWSVL